MQIGLRIGPQNEFTPVPEYLEFVKRAEVLGFDPLLFSDTVSLSHFHLRDPLVVMALAAGATERAGLGTGVTVPFIRHPAVIANAFGSIDDAIAPRRAFLGVGSGDTALYLLGYRAARLAEMHEYLAALGGLLNGEAVTYEGARMRSNWRKPHVPIWYDFIVSVGPDRDAVRRAIRPRLCNRANHNFRVGYHTVPEEHLAGVRAFRENYDESDVGHRTKNAGYVTDYMIDRFAVVGAPGDVVARFETLRAMGVEKAIVAMPFRLEERYEIIKTLAREVMSRFAGTGA